VGVKEGNELDRRLASWRRYEPAAMRALPFLMLGFSTAVAFAVPTNDGQDLVATGVVALLAAAWLTWFLLLRPVTDRTALLYAYGLAVLGAALVVLSPWFGFFSFIGYINALTLLTGAARYTLVVVTAATAAASQIGGVWNIQGAGIAVYLVVFGINAGLFLVFGQYGDLIERQNDQRKETIDELALANGRLEQAMVENAALHDQLVVQAREAGVSEERQRLAREIHDTIAQGLAGIVAQLEAATQGPPAEQARHLDLARSLARESLGEARRSVEALQPGALEDARLPEALAAYVKRWSELNGVAARVETVGRPVPLPTETEVTLYRVAQEALTNVGRHAAATNAVVTVSFVEDAVTLDVGDDGHGFALDGLPDHHRDSRRDQTGSGFGLTVMRQRTAAVGGVLHVDSSGKGTVVHVEVPRVAWADAGGC
jgi:signal transduction histidine kinase